MIEWRDDGIVLAVRRHGEAHALLDVMTAGHGRWRALVHGGASRTKQALLQPGNRLALAWRARLADQLGRFSVEPAALHAGSIIGDPLRLKALLAALALVLGIVPERHPYPRIHAGLAALLELLAIDGAPPLRLGEGLVRFELGLLADLGFGLDLERCAVTGGRDDLVHVSPKSGRAVGRAAGAPWAHRLLDLPAFLRPDARGGPASGEELAQAFRLTGHFLARHAFAAAHRPVPAARDEAVAALRAAIAPPERTEDAREKENAGDARKATDDDDADKRRAAGGKAPT